MALCDGLHYICHQNKHTIILKYRNAILLILFIIVLDQVVKIYIKTHFVNGDDVKILGDWFRLHFIENEGMAYGLKISESVIGKLILSTFRLVAVVFGFYLLKQLILKGYKRGVIICGSLILAGALGNLIDSLFYGQIFSDSPYSCFSGYYENMSSMMANHNRDAVAHFTQFGQGYGKFLQGKVVDMLYFPLIDTTMPKWVPFLGGKPFVFFEPVFNIADAAISIGVVVLVLFQKSLLTKKTPVPEAAPQI